jgi:transcriptional regulator of acetoin/glycerol metabolism
MFKTKKRLLLELFLGIFRHLAWSDPHSDLERAYVLSLLEKNKWNISKAARISGLNRSTFNARLKKLGVSKR